MAGPNVSPRHLPAWHPAALVATGFGLGHLPKAPGTWASLAVLPLAWLIAQIGGRPGIALVAVSIAPLGWWAGQVYVNRQRSQDPGEVVIDEIAAQMLVLTAVPLTLFSMVVGFILFRVFDIVKPWPVSWADRHVKGGLGVMLDDLLAALYAAVGLYLLTWLKNGLIDVS